MIREDINMHLNSILHRTTRGINKLNLRRKLKRDYPVIVYQMGKVGSRSIADSLRHYNVSPVFHVHRLNPDNIAKVRQEYLKNGLKPPNEDIGSILYKEVIKKNRKAKFITLVREPIGRNISAFFENFRRFTGFEYALSNFTMEELSDIFINKYRSSVPLIWFDSEMKAITGIDIYMYPFPANKGYLSIAKDNFEILILKLEVDDAVKEKAVKEFLKLENFSLTRINISQKKDYAFTYHDFLRKIKLPREYVDIMCDSMYIKHFYSKGEIDSIRARWKGQIDNVDLPLAVHKELFKASSRIIN